MLGGQRLKLMSGHSLDSQSLVLDRGMSKGSSSVTYEISLTAWIEGQEHLKDIERANKHTSKN